MSGGGLAVDWAGLGVQGGIERESAVALVLETVALSPPRRQRQDAVAAVERLDGRGFIHAKHSGMAWRIEIEPDDVGRLAFEVGIVGGPIALQTMRLEMGFAPDAMHQILADAEMLGEFAAGPVRRTIAGLAAGGIEDLGAQAGSEFRGRLPGAVSFQAVESVFEKAFLPFPDGRRGGVELAGDGLVGPTLGQ